MCCRSHSPYLLESGVKLWVTTTYDAGRSRQHWLKIDGTDAACVWEYTTHCDIYLPVTRNGICKWPKAFEHATLAEAKAVAEALAPIYRSRL